MYEYVMRICLHMHIKRKYAIIFDNESPQHYSEMKK